MTRFLIAGVLACAAFSGCRICDSPYDYCGPVLDSRFDGGPVTQSGEWMDAPGEPIPAPPESAGPTMAPRGQSVMVPPRRLSR
ncbi:MAG: hypothetical protein SGJ20_20770 [Planctomycetota bacterium]|nr:hypothetical protein [Planctomycetota bacterium]